MNVSKSDFCNLIVIKNILHIVSHFLSVVNIIIREPYFWCFLIFNACYAFVPIIKNMLNFSVDSRFASLFRIILIVIYVCLLVKLLYTLVIKVIRLVELKFFGLFLGFLLHSLKIGVIYLIFMVIWFLLLSSIGIADITIKPTSNNISIILTSIVVSIFNILASAGYSYVFATGTSEKSIRRSVLLLHTNLLAPLILLGVLTFFAIVFEDKSMISGNIKFTIDTIKFLLLMIYDVALAKYITDNHLIRPEWRITDV